MMDRHTDEQTGRQPYSRTARHTARQTNTQTYRQAGRSTHRETDRPIYSDISYYNTIDVLSFIKNGLHYTSDELELFLNRTHDMASRIKKINNKSKQAVYPTIS